MIVPALDVYGDDDEDNDDQQNNDGAPHGPCSAVRARSVAVELPPALTDRAQYAYVAHRALALVAGCCRCTTRARARVRAGKHREAAVGLAQWGPARRDCDSTLARRDALHVRTRLALLSRHTSRSCVSHREARCAEAGVVEVRQALAAISRVAIGLSSRTLRARRADDGGKLAKLAALAST